MSDTSNSGPTDVDMALMGIGSAPNGAQIPVQTGLETPNNGLGTGVDTDTEALDKAVEKAMQGSIAGTIVPDVDGDEVDDDDSSVGDGTVDDGPPVVDPLTPDDKELGGGAGENGVGATGETEGVDFAAQFQTVYGRPPTVQDVNNMLGLVVTLGNMDPERQAAIDDYITGRSAGLGTPAPTPEPVIDPLAAEYSEDPLYLRMLEIQDEQKRINEQVNLQAQDRVAQQQVQITQAIVAGATSFAQEMNMNDEEIAALQGAVAQSRTFPQFMAMANGDPQVAMREALGHFYWRDPDIRAAAIQREVDARVSTNQSHEERKAKAASVTGTGGNGVSRTTPPPKVLSSDDRWGAVAAEIKEFQNNGSPN